MFSFMKLIIILFMTFLIKARLRFNVTFFLLNVLTNYVCIFHMLYLIQYNFDKITQRKRLCCIAIAMCNKNYLIDQRNIRFNFVFNVAV